MSSHEDDASLEKLNENLTINEIDQDDDIYLEQLDDDIESTMTPHVGMEFSSLEDAYNFYINFLIDTW